MAAMLFDGQLDKDLPEDDADIKRLFYACCENHLSNTKLLANITSQAEMCIDELNAGKKEYQKALLNTYSLANTTYKYHNMTWQTDKYGRVYKWSVTIDNSVIKAGRDSGLIKRINASKSAYDTNNMMVAYPNIFPQNKLMNNSGVWKMSENQGLKAASS